MEALEVFESKLHPKAVALWMFPKIGVYTPKSSILIGFSSINHPFWGTTIFGNTLMGKVAPVFLLTTSKTYLFEKHLTQNELKQLP